MPDLARRGRGAARKPKPASVNRCEGVRCAVSIRTLSVWVPRKSRRTVRSAGRGLISTLCETSCCPSPLLGSSRSEQRAKLDRAFVAVGGDVTDVVDHARPVSFSGRLALGPCGK